MTSENIEQLPEDVLHFLGEKKTLTLATAGAGAPRATTLTYVNDGTTLYCWTRSNTATARAVQDNPRVGFAIDEYSEDWRETKGVQGTAECAVVEGEELAWVGELFGRKFPDLRPGATSAVSFFKLNPTELDFIDNTRGSGDPAPDEFRREDVM